MFPVVYLDVTDLLNLITTLGPQWAGYLIAIGCVLYVLRIINKMSTNALHGVADSNQKIELTQVQMVDTLKDLGQEFRDHSKSDAEIFGRISENLKEQTAMLQQRTIIFETLMKDQDKITEAMNRQGDILTRLEERTKPENLFYGRQEAREERKEQRDIERSKREVKAEERVSQGVVLRTDGEGKSV
jgi:hypothetical protein